MRNCKMVWSAMSLATVAGIATASLAAPVGSPQAPVTKGASTPIYVDDMDALALANKLGLSTPPAGGLRGACDPINDGFNCHPANLTLGANFSNDVPGAFRTMDNVVPVTANPTELCFIGRYAGRVNPIANEKFRVRMYADNAGLPDLTAAIFDRTFSVNGTAGVNRLTMTCLDTCPGTTSPVAGGHWIFTADVAAGYPLAAGGCYWIEIANAGSSVGGCSSDWNDDGVVNSNDISAFITSWLDSVNNNNLIADFNGDNVVNSNDISAFISAWLAQIGQPCPVGFNWGWVGSQFGTDNTSLQAADGNYTVFTRVANDRSFCFSGGVSTSGGCEIAPLPQICTNDPANGIPMNGGLTNGFRAVAPGSSTTCGTVFQRAENFEFAAATTVTSVCFGGFWLNPLTTCANGGFTAPPSPVFHINYYADVNGFPAPAPLATFITGQPGVSFIWDGDEVVSVTHPAITFAADTCYYISVGTLESSPVAGQTNYAWVWFLTFSSTPTGDNFIYSTISTDPNGWTRFNISSATQAGNMWFLFNAGPTSLPVCEPPACLPSQIPVNNACENAILLSVPGTAQGTTICADDDVLGFADCVLTASSAPGVWYRVIGTGGNMTASNCASAAPYDGQIAVYTGGCGNAVCVVGADDTCGGVGVPATVTWASTLGTEYLIRVYGWGGATGLFQIDVSSD